MKTIIAILLTINIAIMYGIKRFDLWGQPSEQTEINIQGFKKDYRLWYTKEGIAITHIGECENTYNIQNGILVQHDTDCN